MLIYLIKILFKYNFEKLYVYVGLVSFCLLAHKGQERVLDLQVEP